MRIARFFKQLAAACTAALTVASAASAQPALSQWSGITPEEHRRGTEQTFLTFPEWFLVHSPAEYALFIRENPPSEFPYFGHIGQFWRSYSEVSRTARRDYPPNPGYHLMIAVIGISTTVEYALKAAYETMIGRLTGSRQRRGKTQEDVFAATAAQDYIDFIRSRPWYEYNFLEKITRLWSETSLWGTNPIRKWERKYALTSEYGVKVIYGWLIKKLTKMIYPGPLPVTAIWVDHLPEGVKTFLPDLGVLQELPDESRLITVPRYAAFKHYAIALAGQGVKFREVAGNSTVILISVLAPLDWDHEGFEGTVLFTQPILTQPHFKRVAVVVPILSLDQTLVALDRPPLRVEHVYDY